MVVTQRGDVVMVLLQCLAFFLCDAFTSNAGAYTTVPALSIHARWYHRNHPAQGDESPTLLRLNADKQFVDFSSPSEWEEFYKSTSASASSSSSSASPEGYDVTEWHSSISLHRIAAYITNPNEGRRNDPIRNDNDSGNPHHTPTCLMIGCGNSQLPDAVLPNAELTLLDTSQTCLEQLRSSYGDQVRYVCGNALKLSDCLPASVTFDSILDKGLIDALLCGDGWDSDLERLLRQASKHLVPHQGRYILISYRLP
uniref:Methyltransferase type 11 domain-containing protein n=1 Tax=Craspedostauros australis TaxID=1486917 RepID=A0A7R9ZM84_9STRA|mmetsp:Transcript_20511/g.57067  ORF Transcript_20511/g.57067 Transcript_20511/m.57067 type:complete len:255 (+) Transcript_20511:190-954(+)